LPFQLRFIGVAVFRLSPFLLHHFASHCAAAFAALFHIFSRRIYRLMHYISFTSLIAISFTDTEPSSQRRQPGFVGAPVLSPARCRCR
jgi:hypothetical protein